MAIDPTKWYWAVGNKPDVFFSGAAAAYVAADDTGYVAFLEAGNTATRILTDGELADVLAQRQMPPAMIRAAGWTDWGNAPPADIADVLLKAGLSVTSTGNSALNGDYPSDDITQQHIQAHIISILLNDTFTDGETTTQWPDITGAPHSFDIPHFKAFATAQAVFVTACIRYKIGAIESPPNNTATIA